MTNEPWIDESPPWSYFSTKAAAKILSVSPNLLEGLASRTGKLRFVKVRTPSGNTKMLLNAADVRSLALELGRD